MTLSKIISPPNSVIVLLDEESGVLPATMGNSLIGATTSSIAIGTFPVDDGDTTVILTFEKDWKNDRPEMQVKFTGSVETPRRILQVFTVQWEEIFKVPVKDITTNLQILANHNYYPDKICIILE